MADKHAAFLSSDEAIVTANQSVRTSTDGEVFVDFEGPSGTGICSLSYSPDGHLRQFSWAILPSKGQASDSVNLQPVEEDIEYILSALYPDIDFQKTLFFPSWGPRDCNGSIAPGKDGKTHILNVYYNQYCQNVAIAESRIVIMYSIEDRRVISLMRYGTVWPKNILPRYDSVLLSAYIADELPAYLSSVVGFEGEIIVYYIEPLVAFNVDVSVFDNPANNVRLFVRARCPGNDTRVVLDVAVKTGKVLAHYMVNTGEALLAFERGVLLE